MCRARFDASRFVMLTVIPVAILIGLSPHRHTAVGTPYHALEQIMAFWPILKGLRPAAVLPESGLDILENIRPEELSLEAISVLTGSGKNYLVKMLLSLEDKGKINLRKTGRRIYAKRV